MTITIDFVNAVASEHSRTSCDDNNLTNSYGGWDGKYDPNTGKKLIRFPRCNRCYLLSHVGESVSSLDFKLDLCLDYKE